MLIPSLRLNNLVLIIDNNNLQSLEKTSVTHPFLYPIEKNLKVLDGTQKNVMVIIVKIFNLIKKGTKENLWL